MPLMPRSRLLHQLRQHRRHPLGRPGPPLRLRPWRPSGSSCGRPASCSTAPVWLLTSTIRQPSGC
eukprot:7671110-Alexandrium_andersonii.AAC.1